MVVAEGVAQNDTQQLLGAEELFHAPVHWLVERLHKLNQSHKRLKMLVVVVGLRNVWFVPIHLLLEGEVVELCDSRWLLVAEVGYPHSLLEAGEAVGDYCHLLEEVEEAGDRCCLMGEVGLDERCCVIQAVVLGGCCLMQEVALGSCCLMQEVALGDCCLRKVEVQLDSYCFLRMHCKNACWRPC